MTKKNVIIFGGSGFLGSHVADALSEAGYAVTIFDRVHSPYLRSDQKMIVDSIMNLDAVKAASRGCFASYNFAGIADIEDARKDPVGSSQINVIGNLHCLEAARLAQVERYILASTVYVYSEAGSFYRASKQACERYVEAYAEEFNLKYSILRYGSLFGRRADIRNGIYGLLKQALETKKIVYEGSPDSVREYIHVQDAAQLSVQILKPEYANRHLILTGRERMPVKDLMRMIAEMLPGNVEIKFVDNPKNDGHYIMTPYSFNPKVGHKLLTNDHVDIGQGLLDCLAELNEHNQTS